jgi:hypothetical protein
MRVIRPRIGGYRGNSRKGKRTQAKAEKKLKEALSNAMSLAS